MLPEDMRFKCGCGKVVASDMHAFFCKGWQPFRASKDTPHVKYARKFFHSDWYIADRRVLHCDMETYYDKNFKRHIPYAIALCDGVERSLYQDNYDSVYMWYGPSCVDDFMAFLFSDAISEHCTVFFHNLSFDGSFLFHWILKHPEYHHLMGSMNHKKEDVPVWETMLVRGSSKIISCDIRRHPSIVLRDLCMFIPMSLRTACVAFNIPDDYRKGDINHRLYEDDEYRMSDEGKRELEPYLICDVLAMRYIYLKYSMGIFEQYGLNVSRCYSISNVAYRCLNIAMEKIPLYLPNMEYDEYFRSAYYGGRCRPTTRRYDSSDLSEYVAHSSMSLERWLELDDYLVDVDVSSLYPAVMAHNRYGTGKYYHTTVDANASVALCELSDQDFAYVFVTCPQTIVVPYLQRRDDSGTLVYDLAPRTGWYYVAELKHAVELGYTVRVLEFVHFHDSAPIFRDFVMENYKIKQHATDTAARTLAKLFLNSTYGKFAQGIDLRGLVFRPISELQNVTLSNDTPRHAQQHDEDMPGVHAAHSLILLENDEVTRENFHLYDSPWLGFLAHIHVDPPEFMPYPTYIGAAITANSRILMSKIIQSIDGYTDPRFCYYYTDTDSLLLHKKAVDALHYQDKFMADPSTKMNLGKLEDEFDDNTRIIQFRALAPKTYVLRTVTRNEDGSLTFKQLVRCKGLPHTSAPQPEDNIIEDVDIMQEKLQKMKEGDLSDFDLSSVVYYVEVYNGDDYFVTHLSIREFDLVLEKKGQVTVWFGSLFVQSVVSRDPKVTNLWMHRSLLVSDWWAKNERKRWTDPDDEGVMYPDVPITW